MLDQPLGELHVLIDADENTVRGDLLTNSLRVPASTQRAIRDNFPRPARQHGHGQLYDHGHVNDDPVARQRVKTPVVHVVGGVDHADAGAVVNPGDLVAGGALAQTSEDNMMGMFFAEPFVDVDDIADVAVAALTGAGHEYEIYEVTGPRLMTFSEVAQEISRVTGRDVRFAGVGCLEVLQAGASPGYETAAVHRPDSLGCVLLR